MFRSASSGQDNRDGRSLNDIGKDYGRQVIVRQLNISVWSFISGTFAVKVSPLRTPNSRSLTTTKMINISWMNAVISVYPVHLLCSLVSRGGRKKLLQNEKKIKDADAVKHAHAMRAGIIGVKSEIQVLGKRPNQEHVVQKTPTKRSILSSRDSTKLIVQVTTKTSNAGFERTWKFYVLILRNNITHL